MCVIAICDDQQAKPTRTMLRAMWETNPHGAGLAWREPDGIRFVKGIEKFATLADLVDGVDAPFVVHFRIATAGGVRPELTHPFVISETSPLKLKGAAAGVLFHNGHWGEWQETLRQSTVSGRHKVPDGAFSDSRAMAVLCARHGQNFPRLIEARQRIVIFDKTTLTYYGTGWTELDSGLIVSNTTWQKGDLDDDDTDDADDDRPMDRADRMPSADRPKTYRNYLLWK